MPLPFTSEEEATKRVNLLFDQAKMSAHDYALSAKADIDKLFGEGYAAAHPELVGAYMQTAAADFAAMWHADQMQVLAHQIEDLADQVAAVAGAIRAPPEVEDE